MEIELKENERIDDLDLNGLKIIQNRDGFCFGIDSVLLADFAKKLPINSKVLDLGTGTGILGILLSGKTKASKIYGVDIQEKVCEMAYRSVKLNNLESKIKIINKNIKDLSDTFEENYFDAIVSNPPYIKSEETVDKATLKYEPHLALFASPQTYFYEDIFKNKNRFLNSSFLLAFEIDEDMEDSLKELIAKYFKNVDYIFKKDLYNKTRFLFIWNI